ncbi:hypothetical protein [Gallaecimonas sp. GXIMD1310]|uniref:hypothetical protein n=1 Tax=Gallaecimonas sp. GXIMD1310 TaxID=3131926 RepID=UPI00324DAE81
MIRLLIALVLVAALLLLFRQLLQNPSPVAPEAASVPASEHVKAEINADLLQAQCINAIALRYSTSDGYRVKQVRSGLYQVTSAGHTITLRCQMAKDGQVSLQEP